MGDSVEIYHFDMSRKIRMTIQMEVGVSTDQAQNVMCLRWSNCMLPSPMPCMHT